jgi:hypothetical protein
MARKVNILLCVTRLTGKRLFNLQYSSRMFLVLPDLSYSTITPVRQADLYGEMAISVSCFLVRVAVSRAFVSLFLKGHRKTCQH